MELILSLGSNGGDRLYYLGQGREELRKAFQERQASYIYESAAVDYLQQPSFLNQVIQYDAPQIPPHEILSIILGIEKRMGRTRTIPKGPRTLDIDIIFWGEHKISSHQLQVPHPRWAERSFIYWPLHELPAFNNTLKNIFFCHNRQKEVINDLTLYVPPNPMAKPQ